MEERLFTHGFKPVGKSAGVHSHYDVPQGAG